MLDISNYTKEQLVELIKENSEKMSPVIAETANKLRRQHYNKDVYLRGLIEISSHCRRDCYYCGIRASNKQANRYRLTKEEILECCEIGYGLGFRTFVLQGGEDMHYTDDIMCDIIVTIKKGYPDCAITISLGEKSMETYQRYYDAGADRYLLRHETATEEHYGKIHPANMSLASRKECLTNLKKIGFQVGAGFMVGSPYQTYENLAEDLLFLKELQPHMVGIGPFLPSSQTPFAKEKSGTLNMTLLMVALTRIMLPKALLPATTALGTLHKTGREEALKVGGNVVMPNLSPTSIRKDYALYDNKICTGDEAAECRVCIEKKINLAGYEVVSVRGDFIDRQK